MTAARAWLGPAFLAAYVLFATSTWRVPTPDGAPFGPVWIGATIAGAAVWRWRHGSLSPVALMAVAVAGAALLTDSTQFSGQALRDLHIYTKAGQHFANGQPVYLSGLLTARPADLSNYPYLYPPLTLPFLATLTALPGILVDGGWTVLSAGAAIWSLGRFGLSRTWAVAALAWPPFFQGLYVGNVAVPLLAMFAAAPAFGTRPSFGGGLVVSAVAKPYSAIAALWLLRERRWRDVALGVAIVAGLAIATVPLVGVGRWSEWLAGLDWYQRSTAFLAPSLVAMGLSQYMPPIVALAVAVLVTGLALRARGRDGLERLGVATVVASPSLFAHGFLVGLPAILRLRPVPCWIALGITSVAPGIGWWLALALLVVSWSVRELRHGTTTPDGVARRPDVPS